MLQNPRQKSFKFADLEQAVSDCIHKTCSISSVDDHTLRFAWKAKSLLSSLVGRTRTCDLHAIGIQGNRLFLSTDPDSKENADLLLDDLARTLNNGDATSAWEWSGTTPDDTTESPMIHIGETAEEDGGNSTPEQEYITVFLDRMATTSDFMKANMVESVSFDDEGINIDCRLPKGSRPDGMAFMEAIDLLLRQWGSIPREPSHD